MGARSRRPALRRLAQYGSALAVSGSVRPWVSLAYGFGDESTPPGPGLPACSKGLVRFPRARLPLPEADFLYDGACSHETVSARGWCGSDAGRIPPIQSYHACPSQAGRARGRADRGRARRRKLVPGDRGVPGLLPLDRLPPTAPVDGARDVAIRSSGAGSRCARDGVTVVTGTVTGSGRHPSCSRTDGRRTLRREWRLSRGRSRRCSKLSYRGPVHCASSPGR